MATIVPNPTEDIYKRFRERLVASGAITAAQMAFGSSDVGSKLPWVAFKAMTNYSYLAARDLCNNENALYVNVQIECFSKKESTAMRLEDTCKQVMFDMGFTSSGFNQRFKNNAVHRYISRYELLYTGELLDLSDT